MDCRAMLAVLLLPTLLPSAGCGRPEQAPAANLLFVTLDTVRADHLGLYGYTRPVSPRLDAFAAGAFVFEDATCSVPTTLPSHLSIFTGLRPIGHGVRLNGVEPTRDLLSIFDLLAEQRGAATAAVVASGVLAERYLAGLGLAEVHLPAGERQFQVPAETVTDVAVEWLSVHSDSPFALWVHYYDAHEPYTPVEEFRRRFDRGYDGPLPNRMEIEDLVALNRPEGWAALEEEDLDHVEDLYDAEIAYLDQQLGRLLDAIEELGLSGETLVAIVGDHGQAIGDNAFFGHGRLLEPVIKVPLVLRLPGQAGGRIAAPVETIDLMPTLVELFELTVAPGLPGRSLLPAMRGRSLPTRRLRMIERRHFPENPSIVGAAVHGGDWKGVFYREADGSEQWFVGEAATGLDGANRFDPESRRADSLAAVAARVEAGAPSVPIELDDEQRRMLRALGYLE